MIKQTILASTFLLGMLTGIAQTEDFLADGPTWPETEHTDLEELIELDNDLDDQEFYPVIERDVVLLFAALAEAKKTWLEELLTYGKHANPNEPTEWIKSDRLESRPGVPYFIEQVEERYKQVKRANYEYNTASLCSAINIADVDSTKTSYESFRGIVYDIIPIDTPEAFAKFMKDEAKELYCYYDVDDDGEKERIHLYKFALFKNLPIFFDSFWREHKRHELTLNIIDINEDGKEETFIDYLNDFIDNKAAHPPYNLNENYINNLKLSRNMFIAMGARTTEQLKKGY